MLTGGNGRRAFVRLTEDELDALLADRAAPSAA